MLVFTFSRKNGVGYSSSLSDEKRPLQTLQWSFKWSLQIAMNKRDQMIEVAKILEPFEDRLRLAAFWASTKHIDCDEVFSITNEVTSEIGLRFEPSIKFFVSLAKTRARRRDHWIRDSGSSGLAAAFPAKEWVVGEEHFIRGLQMWDNLGGHHLIFGRMIAPSMDPIWSNLSDFGEPWGPTFKFGMEDITFDISKAELNDLGLRCELEGWMGGRESLKKSEEKKRNPYIESLTPSQKEKLLQELREKMKPRNEGPQAVIPWTGNPMHPEDFQGEMRVIPLLH